MAVLCISSLAGLARLWPALGHTFGGFIWQYDDLQGYSVSYDVPRHWPGPQAGLVPYTTILTIAGRPAHDFAEVYRATPPGAAVTYEVVTPDGKHRTIIAPAAPFQMSDLIDAYGLVFLASMAFAISGYLLIRSASDVGRVLFALIMLAGAISGFYHAYHGSITTPYMQRPILSLMWSPSPALLGALLCHASLVYPRRRWVVLRYRWIVPLLYGCAALLGLFLGGVFWLGGDPTIAVFQPLARFASIGFLGLGIIATLLGGGWTIFRQRDALARVERRQIRVLAVAWILAMLMQAGTIIAVSLRWPTPFEGLIFMAIVVPAGLVYAIKNADLIAQLEAENLTRGELLEEIRVVHQLQERILGDIADELHDSALAESKALEMRLYTLLQQVTSGQIADAAARSELALLHQHSLLLGQTLRQIVEGAKPVDFASEGLIDALERTTAQMNAVGAPTHYTLEVVGCVEHCAIAIKREIYWIVRAAINNVRDHAQARQCTIRLEQQADDSIDVVISDDGQGGDINQTFVLHRMPRRHLGLQSIRTRTARLGGQLQLVSLGRGTRVQVHIPLTGIVEEADYVDAHADS